ncbi:MAG: VOC family protein [Sphingomonas sp.]
MSQTPDAQIHGAAAILPCNDLDRSQAFYERLGFQVTSDHGHYRILADGKGWHLHLNQAVTGWLVPGHNPFGIYLYAEDVDAVADRVRDNIIEQGAPHVKPWGMYEFAVSDPDGTLVRVGRVAD